VSLRAERGGEMNEGGDESVVYPEQFRWRQTRPGADSPSCPRPKPVVARSLQRPRSASEARADEAVRIQNPRAEHDALPNTGLVVRTETRS
jgi:hypothetical protein